MSTRPHGRPAVLWRAPALLALVIGALVALTVAGGGVGQSRAAMAAIGGAAAGTVLPVTADVEASPAPEAPAPTTAVFAHVDGLQLHLPSTRVQLNAFHQASTPGSVAMTPVGSHRVLPSRGRPYPSTSAVDIVLLDDEPVRSPVTGTVTELDTYRLYGRHADRRIRIRPQGAPHLEVVLLHVGGLRVEVGDQVVAGETVLASRARRFPFRSQVDKETAPDAWPHVHLEVKDLP